MMPRASTSWHVKSTGRLHGSQPAWAIVQKASHGAHLNSTTTPKTGCALCSSPAACSEGIATRQALHTAPRPFVYAPSDDNHTASCPAVRVRLPTQEQDRAQDADCALQWRWRSWGSRGRSWWCRPGGRCTRASRSPGRPPPRRPPPPTARGPGTPPAGSGPVVETRVTVAQLLRISLVCALRTSLEDLPACCHARSSPRPLATRCVMKCGCELPCVLG